MSYSSRLKNYDDRQCEEEIYYASTNEDNEDGRLKGTLKLNNSENKTNLLCHRGGNLVKK